MFPILSRDKKISIFLVLLSLLPLPIASSQEADVPSRLMFLGLQESGWKGWVTG